MAMNRVHFQPGLSLPDFFRVMERKPGPKSGSEIRVSVHFERPLLAADLAEQRSPQPTLVSMFNPLAAVASLAGSVRQLDRIGSAG